MIQTGGAGAQTVCDARMAVLRLDVCGLNHRGGIGSIPGSGLLAAIGDGHGPDPEAVTGFARDATVWLGILGTRVHSTQALRHSPGPVAVGQHTRYLSPKHNPWIQMH